MNSRSTLLAPASAALLQAVLGASPLAAQASDTSIVPLNEINVTGSGLPTEVLNSPSSVTVVNNEEISRVPPSSVAQLLRDVPGVRVTESGIERLRIRGESSQRVAIMIDGQRISDHTTYGTPILISPTEIERIEVVRGPSSVVSGNRAIGGVVNIITKRGADTPVEVTASAGYLGANDGYRASASIAGTVENFDYRLSYSQSDLGDRETPNGPLVPSGSEDRDINAFLGYRFGNHYIGARAQDYDLSADVYTGDPAFDISLPKRDLRKYSLFYEGENLTPWMSLLKLDAYTQTIDRQFRNDITFPAGPFSMNVLSMSDDEQTTRGIKAVANLEFAAGHRTVVGLEYEDDNLQTRKNTTTSMMPAFGPQSVSTSFADASIETSSLFAQHEATFGRLTGTVGVRYYNVSSNLGSYSQNGVAQPGQSNSDDRWLGSAGLVYRLTDDAVLRANISQGYTYPSLSQLFLTSTGGGGTLIGNPNLKPETATNYELGARIDRGSIVLDAALFYTRSKDYITAIGTGIPRQSIYQNVNSVDSWGMELAAEFDPGWQNGIRPYLSVANVNREFTYANGFTTRDSGTPDWTGVAGLRADWTAGGVGGTWDLFVRSESRATERNDAGVVVEETGGWGTLNLRGSVDLTDYAGLTFELGNLFDKSYRPIDQIEGPGRYLSVFLTTRF
ncbi:TonB-dependent receptor [Pukyongiella litopenaei]|uniref:TonB-dependent receptor n=1 Tax=Pukyongiella litopenaei TaxID=2605946 RepID=A0A2S0MU33_9RHOB|nr:TonB-dependent receptor [Pukyongiella litopenaei]AVO39406.1 TonB-dependent receptor [Pukyongiella litopenaei]